MSVRPTRKYIRGTGATWVTRIVVGKAVSIFGVDAVLSGVFMYMDILAGYTLIRAKRR